jgi:hypothetical protein
VGGARRRCVADREVDIARLHRLDDLGNSLIVDRLEGDAEPLCQFLAEIDAKAVRFSGLAFYRHRQRTTGKSASAQPACRGQHGSGVPSQCVGRRTHGFFLWPLRQIEQLLQRHHDLAEMLVGFHVLERTADIVE